MFFLNVSEGKEKVSSIIGNSIVIQNVEKHFNKFKTLDKCKANMDNGKKTKYFKRNNLSFKQINFTYSIPNVFFKCF